MSELLIPVRVDLGDSPNKLKIVEGSLRGMAKGADEFASSAKKASDGLKQGFTGDATKTIKQQFREANIELQNLVAKFGALSPQAQAAAARVANLRDVIEDSARAAQSADFEDRFQVIGRAVQGVAGSFQSVVAIQGLFGDQSKETEEALKKVQAAMALTQGIESIVNAKKAFEALGARIVQSEAVLKLFNVAQTATAASQLQIVASTNAATISLGARNAVQGSVLASTVASATANAALATSTLSVAGATGTATTALSGFKLALLSTGIGALIVAIGVAISAISSYNKKLDEAAGASKKLKEENERLKESLENTFKNSVPEIDRQKRIIQNEEKIKNLQAQGGNNEKAINALRRENLDIAIQSAQVELSTKAGLLTATEELALKEKIFRGEQEKTRIGIEETANAYKKTAEEAKKYQDAVTNVSKTLKDRLADIDISQTLFGAGPQLEQRLSAVQEAIKGFLKLGFSIDSDQVKALVKQASELKIQLFKPIKIQTGVEIELQELTNKEAIQNEVEKRIEDLRRLKPIKLTLIELTGDQQSVRDAIKAQATGAVQGFEESKETILDVASTLQSGLADTFGNLGEAIGTAIAEGGNVFEAIGNTLLSSLGDLLVNIGKQIIAANIVIEKAKLAFGIPILGVLTGVAVVALGNILKASIAKQTRKGFATGGFVSGPGTETSDSIPANLSRGEYVIKAKSVRKYGKDVFEKLNRGAIPVQEAKLPDQTNLARLAGLQNALKQFSRSGGSAKALVNSTGGLIKTPKSGTVPALVSRGEFVIDRDSVLKYGVRTFDALNKGTYPQELLGTQKTTGRTGGSSRALVNRFDDNLSDVLGALKFSNGGLVGFADGGFVQANTTSFTRNSGSSKALVNRFDVPQIPNVTVNETFQREVPYIATTRISGQDLKLVLERADRRFANAT